MFSKHVTYFIAVVFSLHLCESTGSVFMRFQKLGEESDLQSDAKVLVYFWHQPWDLYNTVLLIIQT